MINITDIFRHGVDTAGLYNPHVLNFNENLR